MRLTKEMQSGRYGKAEKAYRKRRNKRAVAVDDGVLVVPECALQATCEEYLDRLNLRWVHIPDVIGMLCRPSDNRLSQYQKNELSFYFKGISDIIVFNRTTNNYPAMLAIELKVGKNKASFDQKEFLRYLYGDAFEWAIVRNFDGFKQHVDEFLRWCEKK